jgi:nucleotide-binding universal stress UspA family protein
MIQSPQSDVIEAINQDIPDGGRAYTVVSVFSLFPAPLNPGMAGENNSSEGGMPMSKKVLVPLDSSELAQCTLSHVKELAKYGIVEEVTLLHVVQLNLQFAEGIDIGALKEEVLNASRKFLAGVEAGLKAEGIKVKTDSIEAGSVAAAITCYAQDKGMDLVVIATNGYSGLKKMFLGSVAAGVVQQSNVPVYLIRPEACRI